MDFELRWSRARSLISQRSSEVREPSNPQRITKVNRVSDAATLSAISITKTDGLESEFDFDRATKISEPRSLSEKNVLWNSRSPLSRVQMLIQEFCPSVCPLHAGIVSKRLNISSTFFLRPVVQSFYSFRFLYKSRRETPSVVVTDCYEDDMGVEVVYEITPNNTE